MTVSLRSLVKFLEIEQECAIGLSRLWPKMPNFYRAAAPEVLTERECRDLIRTADVKCSTGLRDLAILRIMLDLGLRCSEVAQLSLEDVDWREGTLAIRTNKQRRERVLPLPAPTGNAIAAYLRTGRPKSESRQLLLCHRVPVGKPLSAVRVRGVVRRALCRIGHPRGGPHLLRRTFATVLHNRGAPLKEVADILGHKSIDTTAVYARLNLRQLEKVALPWPRE
jgi:site-specific recombinase XerD